MDQTFSDAAYLEEPRPGFESGPGADDLCERCRDEVAEPGGHYCSQACAFKAGVSVERARCRAIADQFSDTEDGPNGCPRPNEAMRIVVEIEEGT